MQFLKRFLPEGRNRLFHPPVLIPKPLAEENHSDTTQFLAEIEDSCFLTLAYVSAGSHLYQMIAFKFAYTKEGE